MISISEALECILKEIKTIGIVKVDIVSACGYILAQDVYSNDTLPPFDKSAMDGYALKSEKTTNNSLLEIKGIIKAGEYNKDEILDGQAIKIMTGAPIPPGADCVIEIEKVNIEGNKLLIDSKVEKGRNIIFKGEELKAGTLVLKKGTKIRVSEIGLLASLGYGKIEIYKAPVVACITTGDELVGVKENLIEGKIRNSNSFMMKAMVLQSKAIPYMIDNIPDDKDILKASILNAFENADIVVSTGGASVGDFDFVLEVLQDIGAEIKFTKVAIKPGKPITFAIYKNKIYFSLPGNPLSTITSFEQFVVPAIERILGKAKLSHEDLIKLKIGEGFKLKKGRVKYIYVFIDKINDEYIAYNVGNQCSNHLLTATMSNGIAIIPENIEEVKKGDIYNGRFIL